MSHPVLTRAFLQQNTAFAVCSFPKTHPPPLIKCIVPTDIINLKSDDKNWSLGIKANSRIQRYVHRFVVL